jgi:hypothetical protein
MLVDLGEILCSELASDVVQLGGAAGSGDFECAFYRALFAHRFELAPTDIKLNVPRRISDRARRGMLAYL